MQYNDPLDLLCKSLGAKLAGISVAVQFQLLPAHPLHAACFSPVAGRIKIQFLFDLKRSSKLSFTFSGEASAVICAFMSEIYRRLV